MDSVVDILYLLIKSYKINVRPLRPTCVPRL